MILFANAFDLDQVKDLLPHKGIMQKPGITQSVPVLQKSEVYVFLDWRQK